MFNPAAAMKLMKAKNKFTESHPKFVAFLSNVFGTGIPEGTVIEMTVTKPGQGPVTTNIKVKPEDLELMETLKELGK